MKNKLLISSLLLLLVLVLVELFSRYYLGLGQTPLYMEDKDYEYIYKPNQDIKRFGNYIITNKYSMRSKELNKTKQNIFIFGDSVLNGGSLTDQNALATTLLQNKVNNKFNILNISAGSWGPDNAWAYFKKLNKKLNISKIVLVFSSHDAHDNMEHEKIVGVHRLYPNTQPFCAISDGFFRYFLPMIKNIINSKTTNFEKINAINQGEKFNSGWMDFIEYSKKHKIPLVVILHPTTKEIKRNKYNKNGRKIINMLNEYNIPYLLELNKKTSINKYRDGIHYNNDGQQFLYENLCEILKLK